MGGPPFTGRLQPIILKTPDTKEWGHQKSLPLITFVELCDLSMMHGTHQRGPRWSNGCTKLLLWIQTLICKTKAHILWKWGKKMSSMRFCEQSWHSVTSEQIFLRKWKLLHLRGSDVIPLYQPTAREIRLSDQFWNLQILPSPLPIVRWGQWLSTLISFLMKKPLWKILHTECWSQKPYCSSLTYELPISDMGSATSDEVRGTWSAYRSGM